MSTAQRPSRVIAVIPSRLASTRLPSKPLAMIGDKTMVEWVYFKTKKAKSLTDVIVATDDEQVARVVRDFGGKVVLTSPEIRSGTDRVAAVADQVEGDIFVNVQGDEPLIDPGAIDAAVALVSSGRFEMGTAMIPLVDQAKLHDPSIVKVIADRNERAIYFSRHPIPYSRGPLPVPGTPLVCRQHVGLYVYTREILMQFRGLESSAIEQAEVLEQLRALENGIAIGITEVNFVSIGVDTPEDLEKVRNLWQNQRNLFL